MKIYELAGVTVCQDMYSQFTSSLVWLQAQDEYEEASGSGSGGGGLVTDDEDLLLSGSGSGTGKNTHDKCAEPNILNPSSPLTPFFYIAI